MFMTPVLARAVRIVAEIHHSHGVKAAVSVADLRRRFPEWSDEFWHGALQRAKWFNEPTVESAVLAPPLVMTPRRAQVLLARGVIPASYVALRSWAEACGLEAVIAHHLDQACADPEYLGHRLRAERVKGRRIGRVRITSIADPEDSGLEALLYEA